MYLHIDSPHTTAFPLQKIIADNAQICKDSKPPLHIRNKNYEKENKEFGLAFYASC